MINSARLSFLGNGVKVPLDVDRETSIG